MVLEDLKLIGLNTVFADMDEEATEEVEKDEEEGEDEVDGDDADVL